MSAILDAFESKVFNEKEMRKRLSKDVFQSLKKTINEGKNLDVKIAEPVAKAMKDWAIANGATHYSHWFQPMTGLTAEKQESFIAFDKDGKAILEFSGKELVKGEPDASSFPTGGVRSTFEARGYTAWDPTSYAFIKDGVFYIPTAFCAYSGEALDKKTPLLRSISALSKQGKRILKLFGDKSSDIICNCGAEQEYFLIDEDIFAERKDLIYAGRTLFGAPPSKGQELDDHYFGAIKPRVLDFMDELDEELWNLGIASKTRHNEVAPAQHEIAVVYEEANRATDHNQLIMETLKNVAARHGLVCLLHEKPFAGINGSGKHCNWSLSSSSGENLLDPGKTPKDNARFLLFFSAVIKAVYEYQDLMRISVASVSNDHRLGASEAPPAIISIFVGDELAEILDAIKKDKPLGNSKRKHMDIGLAVLPSFPKDSTDRNRTSPFAFTGNKFEFRMVGSSDSIAAPLFTINTIIADALAGFADRLEKSKDFKKELNLLIKETIKKYDKIVFNGNNYSKEWEEEAKKRGLLNLKNSVLAYEVFDAKKNIKVFEENEVLTKREVELRKDILFENYWKQVNIEALTMRNLTRKEYLPSLSEYSREIIGALKAKKNAEKNLGIKNSGTKLEVKVINKLAKLSDGIEEDVSKLESTLDKVPETENSEGIAKYYLNKVMPLMTSLRAKVDEAELTVSKDYWPLPSYGEILYSVK